VASLGPAQTYAALARAVRKSGLDGLTLRDAYGGGPAAIDELLSELGWPPSRVHPFARHKLHAALGERQPVRTSLLQPLVGLLRPFTLASVSSCPLQRGS
jgi:hypothetical protein